MSVPKLPAGKIVSWVYGPIVEANFVVQMRCGAAPGCAYVTDNVILANLLAGFHVESREMSQARGQTITMIDDDQVPVGGVSLSLNDLSIGGSMNLGSE